MRDIYLRKNFRQPKGCRFFAAREDERAEKLKKKKSGQSRQRW